MGTMFSEFTRCLPDSRVCTRCACRSTSRCFITPKRVRCGNRSTISVVVRGRARRRSRIARRVGSESAFHTASSPASLPPPLPAFSRTLLVAILSYVLQHVSPSRDHILAVLGIDHSQRTMPQRDPAASRGRLYLHFDVVGDRIGHEHRTTQLQQRRSLDNLHKPPPVPYSLASIPVPPAPRFRL